MAHARRHERIALAADVTIQPGEEHPARFSGKVFNVSKGGIAFFSSLAFPPGKLVGMELVVPVPDHGLRRVRLFGATRWLQVMPEGNMLGVELLADQKAGDYKWFVDHFDALRHCKPTPAPTCRQPGFTLVELCIAMVIICLMMTLAAPMFTRAIEQARLDAAAASLKTVWSAQRVYWLEQRTFATRLSDLQHMDLVDRALVDSATNSRAPYVYSIASADASSFVVRAYRNASGAWIGQIQIDQEGSVTGAVTGRSYQVLTPVP